MSSIKAAFKTEMITAVGSPLKNSPNMPGPIPNSLLYAFIFIYYGFSIEFILFLGFQIFVLIFNFLNLG